MGGWTRHRWPIAMGLMVVASIAAWIGWAFRLTPAERSDALALLGITLGLVGILPLLVSLRQT